MNTTIFIIFLSLGAVYVIGCFLFLYENCNVFWVRLSTYAGAPVFNNIDYSSSKRCTLFIYTPVVT